ncbi:hypothetical protein [Paenarthrobacter sp. NPDC058040]|uniref:hypothetical protein n=1 Tax=unclassified Paenarthrobacter TaxID=2634190 RepID=UPI0036DCD2CC
MNDLLTSYDFDLELIRSELFGRHIAGLLDDQERTKLLKKVHQLELDKFVSGLHRGLFSGSPIDKRAEAAERFKALTRGLATAGHR